MRKLGPGALRSRFWRGLGVFPAPLGRLLGALGTLLGPFGRLLGTSWVSLARSWMPPGCQMLPKRDPGSILEGSGSVRGGFWRSPNLIFRGFSVHFVIMFLIVQSPRFCISQRFVFFPSGAAVCAQHLELMVPSCSWCCMYHVITASAYTYRLLYLSTSAVPGTWTAVR